jgi:hypothetical protein
MARVNFDTSTGIWLIAFDRKVEEYMPILDFNTYKAKVSSPFQRIPYIKITSTSLIGRFCNSWLITADAGATPSTAAACDSSTVGALPLANSSGVQRIAQVIHNSSVSASVLIADRLSHMGGLSGAVSTSQTVNTAALTRYTDGVGVFASIDIHTAIGTLATTVVVNYTNTGDESRTSPAIPIGATGNREVNRSILVPLADGDLGIKSVQSIQLASTTDTAGNIGVTLFKPLFMFPLNAHTDRPALADAFIGTCGNLAEIKNNACLYFLLTTQATSTGTYSGMITTVEE